MIVAITRKKSAFTPFLIRRKVAIYLKLPARKEHDSNVNNVLLNYAQ